MAGRSRSRIALGVFLILLGAWFLAGRLFPELRTWFDAFTWPMILIAVGAFLLYIRPHCWRSRHGGTCHDCGWHRRNSILPERNWRLGKLGFHVDAHPGLHRRWNADCRFFRRPSASFAAQWDQHDLHQRRSVLRLLRDSGTSRRPGSVLACSGDPSGSLVPGAGAFQEKVDKSAVCQSKL